MLSLTRQQTELFSKLTETNYRNLNFENSCEIILREICHAIKWDYGEIWIVQENCSTLSLSPSWYLNPFIREIGRGLSWQQFRACSLEFTIHLGEGLPGRVYLSQKTEWVPDVSIQSERYFLRNQIAKAFSVKAGLGFPIFAKQQIKAVFVCFQSKFCQEDPEIMQWLQSVIEYVGPLLDVTQS